MVMEVVAPNGKKMYLALDTGNAFYATTHRDVLERVGLWDKGKDPKHVRQSFVASGPVDSWTKKLTDMSIFGVKVPTSYWDIIDLPSGSAESDGTVGFGFLSNFNITIDYDRRRVWMENFTGKVTTDPEGSSGITAVYSERRKGVVVARVSPDSPASAEKIMVGDNLLMVDGRELAGSIGFNELVKLLDGDPGSKVKLVLSRNGETRRLELERKVLIND
jgi:hypothetical protein